MIIFRDLVNKSNNNYMMKKLLKKLSFVAMLTIAFATVQAQTPVVHLKFDNNLNNDGSSGLIFEVGGANSAGVTVPYNTGIQGNAAINFSAIGDATDPSYNLIQNGTAYDAQIRSTTNSSITGSAARTISAWVRYDNRNTATNGSHTIVNMGDPSSASLGRTTFTFAAANNEIQLGVSGGNVKHSYTNGTGIEDLGWHHVAFTYPSGGTLADVIYYVDGVAVADDNAGSSSGLVLNTTSDKIYIGSNGNNGTKWFDGGGIDDLRIYDVVLTPTQMLAVYNENLLSTKGFAFGELKAYPNAVVDYLYLETASNSVLQVSVFDITGKNIIKTSGNSVDMRGLTSGLYIVKVAQDNKVANLKILKK